MKENFYLETHMRCARQIYLSLLVIKTVYHFVDSNLGVEISSKKKGQQKMRGRVLEVVLPGRGQLTYRGERRVAWWTRGRGKLYRLTIK